MGFSLGRKYRGDFSVQGNKYGRHDVMQKLII